MSLHGPLSFYLDFKIFLSVSIVNSQVPRLNCALCASVSPACTEHSTKRGAGTAKSEALPRGVQCVPGYQRPSLQELMPGLWLSLDPWLVPAQSSCSVGDLEKKVTWDGQAVFL
jgi:hypothetical protein